MVQSQNVFESDLVYFEEYINETVEQFAEPLLNKRASVQMNNDPMTELTEVYDQVKDMEDTIHKLQEIALFLLAQNREQQASVEVLTAQNLELEKN